MPLSGKDWRMSLLMVGSFPALMTLVLIIAVWAERLLADNEEPIAIEESPDFGPESLSPHAGLAVPSSRAALLSQPEL
jgi:hypothetical protein